MMVSSPATVPSTSAMPARSRADATTWAEPGRRAQHDEVGAVGHLDHELAHHPAQVVVGGRALLGVLGDGVGHGAARDAHLHRAELLEVAADRGLGGHHPVDREHLDQLGLAGDRLLLEQRAMRCWRWGLPRVATSRTPSVPAAGLTGGRTSSDARSERTLCMRLAACSQTSDAGPSITSAATSSPRWAGRQCMNTAPGPAAAMSAGVDLVAGEGASGGASASASWPIDVQTSV